MSPLRRAPLPLLLALALAACGREPRVDVPATPLAGPSTAPREDAATTALREASRRCEALRASAMQAPAAPGAPLLEERRVQILGRAKGEPVLFTRAPVIAPPSPSDSPALVQMRRTLDQKHGSLGAVATVIGMSKWFSAEARALLLPEGYLYADKPEVASALVDSLKLDRLFSDPEIWLERGSEDHRLVRKKDGYVYADGADEGEPASLLFGDRVATTRAELSSPLHRDLRALADAEGFDRIRLTHLGQTYLVADLRYSDLWIPALLRADGARLSVECEVVDAAIAPSLDQKRREAVALRAAVRKLHDAVHEQVKEKLRFDEPLKEEGQQDGVLRVQWRTAYAQGRQGYSFNEVGYSVFDPRGRPHPPQVCIDFVLDTFERASGTWWRPRGEAPERVVGKIDFDAFGIENRRSVAGVVKFATEHPEMWSVRDLPEDERVPFADRAAFFESLRVHADAFRIGDVVAIHGLRSDGKMHYHSFLVDDIDPISGIPILLAGNAGNPRVSSWEATMRSAPARSIRHVLRPSASWLSAVLGPDAVAAR